MGYYVIISHIKQKEGYKMRSKIYEDLVQEAEDKGMSYEEASKEAIENLKYAYDYDAPKEQEQ